MAQVAQIPKYVATLLVDLQSHFPDAAVDVRRDRGPGGWDYTIAVVSERLNRMGWNPRHKALFDVARQVLTPEQRLRVNLVPLRAEELNNES